MGKITVIVIRRLSAPWIGTSPPRAGRRRRHDGARSRTERSGHGPYWAPAEVDMLTGIVFDALDVAALEHFW